jgi:CDP-glucose 4,6-dehydratase
MISGKAEKFLGKYGCDKMDFWKDKNVLVTGADGFIGSWLAKRLIDEKANVITIIRDLKKDANFKILGIKDQMTLVSGDIVEYEKVQRAINQFSTDTCFHLAAQAIVPFANHSPLSTFESNIKGTWNILEACRNSKNIERIVVASSDKAYGSQQKLPYIEDAPLLGLYPYDASKACADILSRMYYNTYGIPVAVTRNANTYGGGDMNFSRLIPDAIRCALKREKFVIRSDGTYKRDYMYVKDAVSGYLTLAENLKRKDTRGEAFNFGTGQPVSVLELFENISKLTGNRIKPKILNEAKNEIKDQYLSTEKVKRMFNWKPQYSLEQGLKETIEWYRNYLK